MAEETTFSWRVLNQSQEFGVGESGTATNGVRVYFVTGRGNRGNVFIPVAEYTEERARQVIQAAAAQMDAVSRLVG